MLRENFKQLNVTTGVIRMRDKKVTIMSNQKKIDDNCKLRSEQHSKTTEKC